MVNSRAIVQGCPFSHLIFILCMESLSFMLNEKTSSHLIQVHVFKGGPPISHLLFAYDVLLFFNIKVQSVIHLKVLDNFCIFLEFQANIRRSTLFFSMGS